jgi:hypothetical protein
MQSSEHKKGRRKKKNKQANAMATHLGWRPKVVLADFHQMADPGQKLCVDGEAAVQGVSRLGHQALGEFPLKHEHCTTKERSMQQQLEHKGR